MLCIISLFTGTAKAQLFSDDFESGFGNWTASGVGDASIGTETANSGTSSMRLRWDTISATSIAIDSSASASIEFSVWVRRGDDAFSEDPDIGGTEDLLLEYLDNTLTWVTLETFLAGTPTGQIFTRTYTLPTNALHAGFRIRFSMPGGSGGPPENGGIGWDYWHIDDTIVTAIPLPPPLGLGDCDDFESGFTNWTAVGAGNAGISGFTANSPSASMHLRWDTVTATSNAIDFSTVSSPLITVWVRRGSDTFSENPETGENLTLQYLNNVATWVTLETFTGGGTQGQIFNRSYGLPADAQHAGFQLRFTLANGDGGPPANSGLGWDYWHVDDVCFLSSLNTYYNMDEASWAGAGSVTDSSGGGNNGNPVGGVSTANSSPAIAGSPGTCGYGVFPGSTGTGTFDAVDSTYTPGIMGGVTFWYNSNANWNGGGSADQMLLDASVNLGGGGSDKYFFLTKRGNNGRLRFRLEDSGDTDSQAETSDQSFAAGTWVHIGIAWDLSNDLLEIFINGVSADTSGTNLNGTAPAWNSLYIGDNRTTGVSGADYTGNAANGLIDEVRIYDIAIDAATAAADMAATHPCTLTDHFAISHDGQAVNCQAEPVTIEAHLSTHAIDTTYTGTLNLTTSTSRGDWTIITGNGTLNNGTANDGAATYDMVAADNGSVVLGLKDTTVETININVTDGVVTELSGTALASEDNDLVYAQSGFQFLADSTPSAIGNQIGGKASNVAPGNQVLELQAIRTSDSTGQCESALQGNVAINMAFECRNPSSCTANQVNINGGTATNVAGNPLGPIGSWTNVNLDFGNNTDTTATFVMNYPDVGEIQLHARYNIPLDDGSSTPSGIFMNGSSNTFVYRPFGFYINVTGNPAAANPTGSIFTQAGADFTTTATAVLWQSADDTDNNGIPDNHNDSNPANNAGLSNNTAALNYGQETPVESVTLSADLDQPSGGNHPGLLGGTTLSTFSAGVDNSNTTHYDEVGIIEIRADISDGDYLGIGNPETLNSRSRSGYIGRFIPNHFVLSLGSISNRNALACIPASTFTYLGEELQLEFTLTAENARSPADTTQNYTTVSNFAKLDPTVIANFNIGAIDTAGPTPLTARITEISSAASSPWAAGVSNVFARASLDRDAAMANNGPFDNLSWGIAPADSDGVILDSYNLDVDNNTVDDHGLVANSVVRFGRAFLESTVGSERLPLTLPVRTEYYDGTQFVLNTDDSCTSYNSADLTFSNRIGLPADPTPAGSGTLNNGLFDPANPITLDSGNNTGNIDATLNVPAYLHFDWDGDGNNDNDPTGKATFGVYDTNPRRIFIKEIY